MTRVFNRGELKLALLSVIASLGEGHGYAIMQELQRRVGSQWRPSPGAIYPALVALEEAAPHQRPRSARACASTGSPRRARPSSPDATSSRAGETSPAAPTRGARASPWAGCSTASSWACPAASTSAREQAESIDAALTRTRSDIAAILEEGAEHG